MCQVLEFVERSKQSKSGKCWQMKPDVGKQNVCTIRRLHRESICSKQSVSRRAQPIFFLGSSGRTWPFFAASLISLIIFFSWFWRLVLSRSSSRIDLADALLFIGKAIEWFRKETNRWIFCSFETVPLLVLWMFRTKGNGSPDLNRLQGSHPQDLQIMCWDDRSTLDPQWLVNDSLSEGACVLYICIVYASKNISQMTW